jgi:Zn-dependent protease
MLGDGQRQGVSDGQQAATDLVVGGRADDVDRDEVQRSSGDTLHHAHAAAGQPGIDTENAHAPPLPCVERTFDTLEQDGRIARSRHAAVGSLVVYSVPGQWEPQRRRRAVRPHPIFVAFVAVWAVAAVLCWTAPIPQGGDGLTLGRFGVFLFVVAGWVVTLCFHEFGHAYAAYRAGDHSVESAGYLTLNPFKYAHPFLSIVLPLIFIVQGGIGLPGGAVYLHPHTFHTKAQRSLAAAAGPLSNVVFAAILLIVARSHSPLEAHGTFWAALAFLGFLQVSAAVLNLLPIPGLDGYGIIEPYLDPATVASMEKVKPWGMLGVYILLQVQTINGRFFDLVDRLYGLSGASRALWSVGYLLFRFWRRL